jgi:hypothetical protein
LKLSLIEFGIEYFKQHGNGDDALEAFIERICIIADDCPDKGFDWICEQALK